MCRAQIYLTTRMAGNAADVAGASLSKVLQIMVVADSHGLEQIFRLLAAHLGDACVSSLADGVQQVLPCKGKFLRLEKGGFRAHRLDLELATSEAAAGKLREQGLGEGAGRAWALLASLLAHKLH